MWLLCQVTWTERATSRRLALGCGSDISCYYTYELRLTHQPSVPEGLCRVGVATRIPRTIPALKVSRPEIRPMLQ